MGSKDVFYSLLDLEKSLMDWNMDFIYRICIYIYIVCSKLSNLIHSMLFSLWVFFLFFFLATPRGFSGIVEKKEI